VIVLAQWSKEIFAKNLRKYSERSGKSQKELAEIAGVTATTYSELINAKKYPRIDKIEILADFFGILKSDLIQEKMTPEQEKDNEAMVSILVRMRKDKDFLSIVEELNSLDSEKIKAVREMLKAFRK
jgi:transcriptional regulator with XRE-family HTH domain